MKKWMILLSTLSLLAACNTMEGMGKDVESAGESISHSATKVKKKISN